MADPNAQVSNYEHQPFLEDDERQFVDETNYTKQYNAFRSRKRGHSWLVTAITHSITFILPLLLVSLFPSITDTFPLRLLGGSSYTCPTALSPIKSAVRYVTDTPPVDYWYNELYSGTPNHESDAAWDELIKHHGFRLHPEEATALNITESVMLPGGDSASILGVMHNLHCLRRLRQTLHSDYYYSNFTEAQRSHDDTHNQHCIETLRTSLMCQPDLSFYPYYWSGIIEHNLSVRPNARRECVDWQSLLPVMRARQYEPSILIKPGGGLSDDR